MTTEEKNKLICKFMGFETILGGYKIRYYPNISDGNYLPREMKFETSYDWQMSVLLKIRRMGFHFQIGELEEEKACLTIKHPQMEDKVQISIGNYDALPNIIYEGIVQWISWYYDVYMKNISNVKVGFEERFKDSKIFKIRNDGKSKSKV